MCIYSKNLISKLYLCKRLQITLYQFDMNLLCLYPQDQNILPSVAPHNNISNHHLKSLILFQRIYRNMIMILPYQSNPFNGRFQQIISISQGNQQLSNVMLFQLNSKILRNSIICLLVLYNKSMRECQRYFFCKRKYSKISIQKRLKLVQLVQEENQAVTKAAKKLSIKLCTARIILKKYKETGKFPMKPVKKSVRERKMEFRQIKSTQNDGTDIRDIKEQQMNQEAKNVKTNQEMGQQNIFTHFYYYFTQYQPFYGF